MHDEAALLGGFTLDLDGGLEGGGGPVDEPAGEALISEDMPDRAAQVGAEQGGLPAVAILPRSRQDSDGDQQPGSVGDDEPLASVDLMGENSGLVSTPEGCRWPASVRRLPLIRAGAPKEDWRVPAPATTTTPGIDDQPLPSWIESLATDDLRHV
jgi:hypothetical protein